MLKKLLQKKLSSKKKAPSAIETISQLHETLEMLEERERLVQRKVTTETEKVKEYTKLKNKNAAIQCLKKKKLYEAQVEQLANSQLRVHDQIIVVESAKAMTDTIDALKSGSAAVKSLQQDLSVDEIEKVIEETKESSERMKETDVLMNPIGLTSEFDEDELEAELEELEALDLETELAQLPSNLANNNIDELSKLDATKVTKKSFSRSISDINEHLSLSASRTVSRSFSDLSESSQFDSFTKDKNLRNMSDKMGESSKLNVRREVAELSERQAEMAM